MYAYYDLNNVLTCQINMLVIGSNSVGKSSIIFAYGHGEKSPRDDNKIITDFDTKFNFCDDGSEKKIDKPDLIRLKIRNDGFSLGEMVYGGISSMDIIIIVYDVCFRESFDNAKYYIESIKMTTQNSSNVPIIALVGNKIDAFSRKITTLEGETLSKKYELLFFECDAKTKKNIDMIFDTCLKKIFDTRKIVIKEKEKIIYRCREHPLEKSKKSRISGCSIS